MLTKSVVGELSRSSLRSAALLGIKKESESLSKRYRLAFDGAAYQSHSKELMKEQASRPDAHLEAIVLQAQAITEAWAKRHEFWEDSTHKNPLAHCDTEPGEGVSILTLCSDGMPARCLPDEVADRMATAQG